MTQPNKKLQLSFTELEFFDSVVISTVKEDILIDEDHIRELRDICQEYFEQTRYVYITNRKNNYNVNPVVYLNLIENPLLKGIAVISDKIDKIKTANFEKQFSPIPFELFHHQEEALTWAKRIQSSN